MINARADASRLPARAEEMARKLAAARASRRRNWRNARALWPLFGKD